MGSGIVLIGFSHFYEYAHRSSEFYLGPVRKGEVPGRICQKYAGQYDEQTDELLSVYHFITSENSGEHSNNGIDVRMRTDQSSRLDRKKPYVG